MNENKTVVCQVLTEFIEIAIHNILKIRQIYIDSIFIKKQKYGIVIYEAIHPQLKEYISNCMEAVYELAKENQLSKVVICFIKSPQIILERIVFDIESLRHVFDKDPFLLDIEKSFKSFFCRLHTLNEYLSPLEEDITFALQIHTTESSGISYMENPARHNFPWMQINSTFDEIYESEIVPMETFNNNFLKMQVYLEKNK